MKTIYFLPIALSILFIASSCDDDSNIDTEKPFIDNSIVDAFPNNCDTLYFGETFTLKLLFTDNLELGSYSIDIHHNFDHHSHSTEVSQCSFDDDKEAVNPFTFIDDYAIPDGLNEYFTNVSISITDSNESGIYDEGDYHFFIRLTDKEGWSIQKGLSIKMLHR